MRGLPGGANQPPSRQDALPRPKSLERGFSGDPDADRNFFDRPASCRIKPMAMANTKIDCDPVTLVNDAQSGSNAAMHGLIALYQDRIAGFVYSMVGTTDQLQDLCQTTFVKMISGLPRLKAPERFEVWLFRIARNVCTDHFRRERFRRMLVPFRQEHEPVGDGGIIGESRLEAFRGAIQELPARQRELLVLMGERDWSYEDLARITGSTVSSVKSRLFRARDFLRRRMEA
jgi:RNA polymerase sigma-70 factor, ECF subfamily